MPKAHLGLWYTIMELADKRHLVLLLRAGLQISSHPARNGLAWQAIRTSSTASEQAGRFGLAPTKLSLSSYALLCSVPLLSY